MSEAASPGSGDAGDQPSLGSLISVGFNYIFSGSQWITAFPGICLVVLVLVINLLGDWLAGCVQPEDLQGMVSCSPGPQVGEQASEDE